MRVLYVMFLSGLIIIQPSHQRIDQCGNITCYVEADKCIVNDQGDLVCGCFVGVRGDACDIDRDECTEHVRSPCGHRGHCQNTFGSYKCDCLHGWEGLTCRGRTSTPDFDCFQGWEGKFCMYDIDECKNGSLLCPEQDKVCQNTEGSYRCIPYVDLNGTETNSSNPNGLPNTSPISTITQHNLNGPITFQQNSNRPMITKQTQNTPTTASKSSIRQTATSPDSNGQATTRSHQSKQTTYRHDTNGPATTTRNLDGPITSSQNQNGLATSRPNLSRPTTAHNIPNVPTSTYPGQNGPAIAHSNHNGRTNTRPNSYEQSTSFLGTTKSELDGKSTSETKTITDNMDILSGYTCLTIKSLIIIGSAVGLVLISFLVITIYCIKRIGKSRQHRTEHDTDQDKDQSQQTRNPRNTRFKAKTTYPATQRPMNTHLINLKLKTKNNEHKIHRSIRPAPRMSGFKTRNTEHII